VTHASPPPTCNRPTRITFVAHIHYVLFGGTILGLFAGMYYWWPRWTGRLLSETLGKWHFWLTLIGMNLAFFPMHFSVARHAATHLHYSAESAALDSISYRRSVRSSIGIATLVFLVNLLRTYPAGQRSNDPWAGRRSNGRFLRRRRSTISRSFPRSRAACRYGNDARAMAPLPERPPANPRAGRLVVADDHGFACR